MDRRIPDSLTYLLSKYYQLLEKELGDSIHGVYIYGSIATGSYDDEKSDIDFMTVINGEITDEKIEKIKSVHKDLRGITPDALKMEGEYVNRYDLEQGRFDSKYPYIADGRFQEFVPLKYMTLFQVKEFGITLYGEEFSSIKFDIGWEKVEKELKERLHGYWLNMAEKKGTLLIDGWVAMITLNVCRLFYALENMNFTSKAAGGKYALENLPTEWHRLIREALRIQDGTSKQSLFTSRWERRKALKSFVNYLSDCLRNNHNSCSFYNDAAM